MRIGTTSYIIPADIVTNVRELAGRVQDVELVIFESPDHGNNYPDRATIRELHRLAVEHDVTYTVHLPLHLRLADPDPEIETACSVIANTADLRPVGYIVHLDGERPWGPTELDRWLDNSERSLQALSKAAGGLDRLCVENLDDQPPEMLDALLDALPVPCCIDIGHLWKRGLDPIPHMEDWLPRARVVHLHGVGDRDHTRLSLMPPSVLDPVVDLLCTRFEGVLTFEVFSERSLNDSLATFEEARARVFPRS